MAIEHRIHETKRLTVGQKVTMAGFPGVVVRLYADGEIEGARMYEVRLPGGVGCYCGSDLIPAALCTSGGRVMARNMYRHYLTGKWNHEYLRICSVHKLLDRGVIIRSRAIELLTQRKVSKPERLVDLWIANPPQQPTH